jgi:hypothetical protein
MLRTSAFPLCSPGVKVHRYVPGLSLVLALVLTSLRADAAPAAILINFAETPVHLWRDTARLSAGRGATLQANDLVDSGAAAIQLGAGDSTIALGPDSQVFVKNSTELVLLRGWLKVRGAPVQGVRLATAQLQFDSTGATVTLHAAPDGAELFAEAGEVLVTELPAARGQRGTRVPREQFGAKSGALPLKVSTHPPRTFLSAMPRGFFDALITVAPKGPALPPRRERPATFEELAPLLADHPALLQQVQRRFQPAPARAARGRLTNELF